MWDDDVDFMTADKEDREETGRTLRDDETRRLLGLLPDVQEQPANGGTHAE